MITIDTHVAGFDARSWHRLVTLVAPGLASRAPYEFEQRARAPGGTLLVLYHNDRVLRALHTHRGIVECETWPGPGALGELADAHGASFVLAAEAGAMEELYERFGGRIRMDDDFVTAIVTGAGALRELQSEGALHVWPTFVPEQVPLPTPAVVRRLFDYLLPDGKAALLALFDRDEIDTAVLVTRRGDAIDRVYGPEVLRDYVGPLGGDFRRDYRVVREAVEREVGPLAIGLFSETSIVHELLRSTEPGHWARAIASRDVIVDPMPGWLAVAAGAGAVRAAAVRSRGLMAGLGILGALSPTVRRIREVAETVAGIDVERVLGFNPFQVLAAILNRSSPSGSAPRDEDVD